ncbi:hypothetical protein ACQZV8_15220 [Magnetococcales bacterium HHB-1]
MELTDIFFIFLIVGALSFLVAGFALAQIFSHIKMRRLTNKNKDLLHETVKKQNRIEQLEIQLQSTIKKLKESELHSLLKSNEIDSLKIYLNQSIKLEPASHIALTFPSISDSSDQKKRLLASGVRSFVVADREGFLLKGSGSSYNSDFAAFTTAILNWGKKIDLLLPEYGHTSRIILVDNKGMNITVQPVNIVIGHGMLQEEKRAILGSLNESSPLQPQEINQILSASHK